VGFYGLLIGKANLDSKIKNALIFYTNSKVEQVWIVRKKLPYFLGMMCMWGKSRDNIKN
jgi:hypothetical protein